MSLTQTFFIDIENKKLVTSFSSKTSPAVRRFTQGDSITANFILLTPSGSDGQPWKNVEITNQTLRVGLGRIDVKVLAGTYILDFDGEQTSALTYDAIKTDIQAALNNLANITSAGGVTVTGDGEQGPFTIRFNNPGARNFLTADVSEIEPTAIFPVIRKVTGDVSTKEQQVFKIRESLVSADSNFAMIPSPTIEVKEVIAGATGVDELQVVEISQICQGGSFTLIFSGKTAVIPYNSSESEVEDILEALDPTYADSFNVVQISETQYNIYFTGTLGEINHPLLIADPSGLQGFSGFTGDMDLTHYAVEELLNEQDEQDVIFEVELNQSGKKQTVLRVNAKISNDGISDAQLDPPRLLGTDWRAELDAKADQGQVDTIQAKIDTVENNAKDDQTAAEIKTLYDSEVPLYTTAQILNQSSTAEGRINPLILWVALNSLVSSGNATQIQGNDVESLSLGAPENGMVPTWNFSTNTIEWQTPPGASGGEANTLEIDPAATGLDITSAKSVSALRVKGLNTTGALTSVVNGSDIDLGINSSSETLSGVVQLATPAQTISGSSSALAVHPAAAAATYSPLLLAPDIKPTGPYTTTDADNGKWIIVDDTVTLHTAGQPGINILIQNSDSSAISYNAPGLTKKGDSNNNISAEKAISVRWSQTNEIYVDGGTE